MLKNYILFKFYIPVSRNNISVITQLQEKMHYIVNVVAFLCTFDVHALQKLSRSVVKYRMLLVFFSDTAYCRNPCTEKWFKYDDDHVSEMKESDVRVSIYTRFILNFHPLSGNQS